MRFSSRLPALFLAALLCLGSGARALDWSPDGRQIVLGGSSLRLADSGGAASGAAAASLLPGSLTPPPSGVIALPGAGPGAFPVWSPDGRTIAYLAEGHRLTLYDLARQQGRMAEENAVTPVSWAPDSKSFAVVRAEETGALQLKLLYRDGGTALTVDLPFRALPVARMRVLAWIPRTDNVVLAGGEGNKVDLYLIDQGQVERLTSSSDILGFIVSQDGRRVLWARRSLNTHYIVFSLYEMNIQTRTVRKLNYPMVLPAVNPNPRRAPDSIDTVVFSPDGRRLTFVAHGGPGIGPNGVALYLSDITGASVRPLGQGKTLAAALAPPKPQSGQAAALPPSLPTGRDLTGLTLPMTLPAFSPDGQRLVALRFDGGKRTLLLVDAATGQTRAFPLPPEL
ncbi:MAG TPA: hypothetical protein VFB21_14105 [Chthonomonadaceae bacterium]|nr:hypothetical protein [Chthonomonadaceae bacterium]